MKITKAPVALISGNKNFPLLLARKARSLGRPVFAVAFTGVTDPALAALCDDIAWIKLGQLQALIDFFHKQKNVTQVMMAGGFSVEDLAAYEPDQRAINLLETLSTMNNDALLAAISDELAREGLPVVGATEVLPEILASPGVFSNAKPHDELYEDLRLAWQMAKEIGRLDAGQTAVVSEKRIMALEGADGTDATIIRGGGLAKRPGAAAKVAKPGQDIRFDLPVIGLGTMKALIQGHLAAMVVEADYTLIFDREEIIELANANQISLLAWQNGALKMF